MSGARARAEEAYKARWKQVRECVSGYNCFGHAFALRRTSILEMREEDHWLIDRVLIEDGFSEVSEANAELGDVVVYYDGDEPFHAGTITRGKTLHLPVAEVAAAQTVWIVRSKLDSMSGEYEHAIGAYTDADDRPLPYKVYRARGATPARLRSWRERIADLG